MKHLRKLIELRICVESLIARNERVVTRFRVFEEVTAVGVPAYELFIIFLWIRVKSIAVQWPATTAAAAAFKTLLAFAQLQAQACVVPFDV